MNAAFCDSIYNLSIKMMYCTVWIATGLHVCHTEPFGEPNKLSLVSCQPLPSKWFSQDKDWWKLQVIAVQVSANSLEKPFSIILTLVPCFCRACPTEHPVLYPRADS